MDRVSFRESLKAYGQQAPSSYKGTTRHGTKYERVHEELLLEFVQYIMEQCPWLNKDLKQMVKAPDGTHVIPAVILKLGGDIKMEKRRVASVLLFGLLSSNTPRKENLSRSSAYSHYDILFYNRGIFYGLVDWCFQLNCDFNFA